MYYIGVDLGTSAVKLLLMDSEGKIENIVSKDYPLSFPHPGWSEQSPLDWYTQSMAGLKELLDGFDKSKKYSEKELPNHVKSHRVIREENAKAVVFDNNAILDSSFDPNLELITTEEVPENKIKKEGPNLNLGVDGAGKAVGGRNKNDKILELHNLGKSNMAIAKELGLGVGEVKLVIDLFSKKR